MIAPIFSSLVMLLAPAPQAAGAASPAIHGVWHNPKNSVAVRTGACGDKLCGWIVRANEHARQRAMQKAGVSDLVGTALLRDYTQTGRNRWSGTLYVPDRKISVGSTLTLVDANTLSIKGCLIGGFLCKTQIWVRE